MSTRIMHWILWIWIQFLGASGVSDSRWQREGLSALRDIWLLVVERLLILFPDPLHSQQNIPHPRIVKRRRELDRREGSRATVLRSFLLRFDCSTHNCDPHNHYASPAPPPTTIPLYEIAAAAAFSAASSLAKRAPNCPSNWTPWLPVVGLLLVINAALTRPRRARSEEREFTFRVPKSSQSSGVGIASIGRAFLDL